jgi:hypothetical protein
VAHDYRPADGRSRHVRTQCTSPTSTKAIRALAASGVTDVRLQFGHRAGLQLALLGDVLVLAGTEEMLAPFRATDVTVIVEGIEQAIAQLPSSAGRRSVVNSPIRRPGATSQ